MNQSATRSLKYQYDLFIENEIEAYKEKISRTDLLKIGDEAVAALHAGMQFTMSELLLVQEVDRIIRKRLRLPSFATWRKAEIKRQKEREEFLRPERWGISPTSVIAREIHPSPESHVLVAGSDAGPAVLYLAAHGCEVTAINGRPDANSSNLPIPDGANLPGRIDHHPDGLKDWSPQSEKSLSAVVCTPKAFAGLTAKQRANVIATLQSATEDGGVHLVETIIAGQSGVSLSELRKSYKGWEVSVLEDGASGKSFLARKAVA
jgi:hypothetical protein